MLLQWTPHLDRAVLVVVPTQHAAQMLIESFVTIRNWERCQLQLRTGADKDDLFLDGVHKGVNGDLWNARVCARFTGWIGMSKKKPLNATPESRRVASAVIQSTDVERIVLLEALPQARWPQSLAFPFPEP